MEPASDKHAWTIAICGGALLWLGATMFGGRGEAWDSPLYWTVAYPLSLGLAAVLGYLFPRKPWRCPLAVMFSQAVVARRGIRRSTGPSPTRCRSCFPRSSAICSRANPGAGRSR